MGLWPLVKFIFCYCNVLNLDLTKSICVKTDVYDNRTRWLPSYLDPLVTSWIFVQQQSHWDMCSTYLQSLKSTMWLYFIGTPMYGFVFLAVETKVHHCEETYTGVNLFTHSIVGCTESHSIMECPVWRQLLLIRLSHWPKNVYI